jgi:hypothetical protein
MNKSLLYNPFLQIAGFMSFLTGFFILVLTSYLAYITGTHFFGFLRIDFAKDSAFWVFLLENCLPCIVLSVLFYAAGLIFSKSNLRIIDILGVTVFSRVPLIFVPALRTIKLFQSFGFLSVTMYIVMGIYLFTLVWSVVLLYNGFKISCNLKDEKLVISFITCMILSEVLVNIFLSIL